MARKKTKILRLTGSQAKNDLKLQSQAGGVKGGMGVANYYKKQGNAAASLQAAARVVAIRKARKEGNRGQYKKLVQENRTARLGINKQTLGLHGNGYGGKKDMVSVGSKAYVKGKIKKGKLNARTQRGVV